MTVKGRPMIQQVWVSPTGNDKAAGTKGRPVATLRHAVDLLRRKRREAGGGAGRIMLAAGTHFISEPLVLDHRDSRLDTVSPRDRDCTVIDPVVIGSAPGEHAVISGGRRITGWRTTQVNGVDAWVVSLPRVKSGAWNFTQLWVNGRRAPRPRLPEVGTCRIEQRMPGTEGHSVFRPENRFGYAPGELWAFRNLADVDFVALHFWIESRIPLAAVDEINRVVTLAHHTRMQLTDNHGGVPAPYYVENVAEALSRPGQWYLDRPAGKLYYVPRAGETPNETEVIAPALDHLVRIEGDPEQNLCARHIELHDLILSHCEHVAPADSRGAAQAACHVVGAVRMLHARHCALRGCTVEHVGCYGVEIAGDSSDCEVRHCTIRDTAAGGVKIFHHTGDTKDPARQRAKDCESCGNPRRIVVADCHIHDGGHRWRQAVGVLIGNCSGIEITHCHVHDFDYTGISVGWTWGYKESHTYGNVIEWNHIHDIGRGMLSDMGGIYTLGRQPGTRLRYNHIHHVDSRGYGGWGIYPDEGSCNMLIEFNLVHDTKCDPFSQHYGHGNIVRNNIFAFGRQEGMVGLSRFEAHNAFTFEHNIVLTDGLQITRKPWNQLNDPIPSTFDYNLYFDVRGRRLRFSDLSWSAWRKSGQDKHSLNADPKFANAGKRDFRLRAGSPAEKIGFVAFDLEGVGPRSERG